MDTKYDAIKYFNQLNVSWLDRNVFIANSSDEKKLNPLMFVIYEILNEEIVIPILQFIEYKIGDNDISFTGFSSTEDYQDINLYFEHPGMSVNYKLGVNEIVQRLINEQKKTDALNIHLNNYY